MPKSKNQANGFWLFATNNKSKWKADGMKITNNEQMLAVASRMWKGLSPEEKKQWDQRAKEERQLQRNENNAARLDNVGNVIGSRVDPLEQARRRREQDIHTLTSQWNVKDLPEEKFYFVNFQAMVELTESDNTVERRWLPREMAVLEYSLRPGIIRVFHKFIWPDGIPVGFRSKCNDASTNSHKIPTDKMEIDSEDYASIWNELMEMMRSSKHGGQYPPVFCLANEYEQMKYFMDWLWMRGAPYSKYGDNPLGKVYALEDMVCQLLAFSGQKGTENVSRAQVIGHLDGTQWDFLDDSCEFHKELDVARYCAQGVVRRVAYTVSDMVCHHYGIELTENHVPVRDKEAANVVRVVPPQPVVTTTQPCRGRGRPAQSGNKEPETIGPITAAKMRQQRQQREDLIYRDTSEDEMFAGTSTGAMWNGGAIGGRNVGAPCGSVNGQFDDWPELGGSLKKQADSSTEDESSEFPSLVPLSQVSISEVSATTWNGRAGRGTTTALSAQQQVVPPPGFRGVGGGQGPPAEPSRRTPTMGRGAAPHPSRKPSSTWPALGGTDPQAAAAQGVTAGTGSGRGFTPPSAGRGYTPPLAGGKVPPFGRGRLLGAGQDTLPVGRGRPASASGDDGSSWNSLKQPVVNSWGQPVANSSGWPVANTLHVSSVNNLGQSVVKSVGQCGANSGPPGLSQFGQPVPSVLGRVDGEMQWGGGTDTMAASSVLSEAAGGVAKTAGRGFTPSPAAGQGYPTLSAISRDFLSSISLPQQNTTAGLDSDTFQPEMGSGGFPSLQGALGGAAASPWPGSSRGRGYTPSQGRGYMPGGRGLGRGYTPR